LYYFIPASPPGLLSQGEEEHDLENIRRDSLNRFKAPLFRRGVGERSNTQIKK
jgi:hypothetical protein